MPWEPDRNKARLDRKRRRREMRKLPFAERAVQYANMAHNESNSYYFKDRYQVHLAMICDFAIKHMDLIAPEKQELTLSGCWCSGIMEHTKKKYEDVEKIMGRDLAELIRKVTPDIRGRNEKERFSDAVMKEIYECKEAVFIKLCDRIAKTLHANMKSKRTRTRLVNDYKRFVSKLYRPDLAPLFEELEKLTKDEESLYS